MSKTTVKDYTCLAPKASFFKHRVRSRQLAILFVFIKHPIKIDVRKAWYTDLIQDHPNGSWLKIMPQEPGVFHKEASHGVIPCPFRNKMPNGWVRNKHVLGTFDKAPILVGSKIFKAGEHYTLQTLDHDEPVKYDITEDSVLVCNTRPGTKLPYLRDCWIMSVRNLKKNYNTDKLDFLK